jgi:hypothetical protein
MKVSGAVSKDDGTVVCERCAVADRPASRLMGLMGRRGLDAGEGLLLSPAGSIHTCFMRFRIDAVFLDSELEVVRVRPNLRPWRAARARGARAVLELPAGESERLGVAGGERLRLRRDAPEGDNGRTMGLSSRYMAVALGVGIAAAGAALVDFGLGSRGLIAAAFVAVLAVLGAGDAEKRTIPNRIVLPAIALVLVAQLAFFGDRALEWLGAGAGAALLLQVPAWIRPGSVGQGDVKLALLLGVGLGRDVVTALLIGSLAAFPVALWIVFRGGWSARKRAIPLGPFLAVGGILATFSGGSL